MSSSSRILVLVATVAVLAIAFFVLAPGDDDDPDTAATTTATTTVKTQPTTTAPTTTEPAPRPAARFEKVRVRGGKPVGGVQRIRLRSGARARIEISSPDTADEIHIHGYDLSKDLRAPGSVRFSFEADAEGIFEIELESAGVQIAELVVEPR